YPGCRDPRYPGASGWETLECNGPLTRTVEDSAKLLSVIAGPSHLDRHSIPDEGMDYLGALNKKDIKGLKVAWSPDLGYAAVDPQVRKITEDALKVFEDLGCEIEEVNPGFQVSGEEFWTLVARDTDLKALRKIQAEDKDIFGPTLSNYLKTNWTAEDFTEAH